MVQNQHLAVSDSFLVVVTMPRDVIPGNWLDVRILRTKKEPRLVCDTQGNAYYRTNRKNRWVAQNVVGGPTAVVVTFTEKTSAKVTVNEKQSAEACEC